MLFKYTGENSMEIKREGDSSDTTACTPDINTGKPGTDMFLLSVILLFYIYFNQLWFRVSDENILAKNV